MIKDLLKYLYSYKVSMDYKAKNFDGNGMQQYAVLRVDKKYGQKNMVKKVFNQQKHIFR